MSGSEICFWVKNQERFAIMIDNFYRNIITIILYVVLCGSVFVFNVAEQKYFGTILCSYAHRVPIQGVETKFYV